MTSAEADCLPRAARLPSVTSSHEPEVASAGHAATGCLCVGCCPVYGAHQTARPRAESATRAKCVTSGEAAWVVSAASMAGMAPAATMAA